jgi:hypothetical protein
LRLLFLFLFDFSDSTRCTRHLAIRTLRTKTPNQIFFFNNFPFHSLLANHLKWQTPKKATDYYTHEKYLNIRILKNKIKCRNISCREKKNKNLKRFLGN